MINIVKRSNSLKEKDRIHFASTSDLNETPRIRERCTIAYIEQQIKQKLPNDTINIVAANINETGFYRKKSSIMMMLLGLAKPVKNLPPYCEIKLEHNTGEYCELITVWSPLSWNDRFAGTAGGGVSTGGIQYITRPDNTVRGWTLPFALLNGFTTATVDAGNVKGREDKILNSTDKKLNWELMENWRARGTHIMTVIGKAVAEILHARPVRYSYMHGGSGGGRQAMVEAQEYPEDYDGIWATCPAINWTKFVLTGLWPIAVMNSNNHILKPKKLKYFIKAVQKSVGGKKQYHQLNHAVEFNPEQLIGQKTKQGVISELDAKIIKEIWNGPRQKDGQFLWYGFRPGITFWNVAVPVGSFYYSLFTKKPKPFFLITLYARWITRNPKQKFTNITTESFETLFNESITNFSTIAADQSDLSAFVRTGGKLLIDHGLNDPLIPVDGTLDYFNRLCKTLGGKNAVDQFCRLYLTPGDGHGHCRSDGPGLTESTGMRALMDWVERGKTPEALRTVQVHPLTGNTIRENLQQPV